MGQIAGAARPDNRYYSLDIWRGFACLIVVVLHSTYYATENPNYPSGALHAIGVSLRGGVPIFFVISGYCITAACDNLRSQRFAIRRYFLRRFRRIFPPYWIALAVTVGVAFAFIATGHGSMLFGGLHPMPDPRRFTAAQWAGNVTLTEMWRPNLVPHSLEYAPDNIALGPAWSLCYEEQFYAVCGLALFLSRRHFFRIVTIVTALVLALTVFCLKHPLPIKGFFFDGLWLSFAAGVAVYYRLRYATPKQRWLLDAYCLILIPLGVIARRYDTHGLHVAGTYALLLIPLYSRDLTMRCNPVLKPIAWCGRISYSMYLIHWITTRALAHGLYDAGLQRPWQTLGITLPICTTASILGAWVFFRLVERRFLNPPTAPVAERVPPVAGEAQVLTAM